jgi:hypothetical protein
MGKKANFQFNLNGLPNCISGIESTCIETGKGDQASQSSQQKMIITSYKWSVSQDAPAGTVLVYINSDLSKAAKLGGAVLVHKTEIPGEGWFGIFSDPTGNKLALFTTSHTQQM